MLSSSKLKKNPLIKCTKMSTCTSNLVQQKCKNSAQNNAKNSSSSSSSSRSSTSNKKERTQRGVLTQRGVKQPMSSTNLSNENDNKAAAMATTLCCRDLNCSLNAHLRDTTAEPRRGRSPSVASSTHSSCTTTTNNDTINSTTNTYGKTNELRQREPLPDSGVDGSDPDALLHEFNNNYNKNYNSHTPNAHTLLNNQQFIINFNVDLLSWLLFVLGLLTRFYKLSTPSNVVFDELHYGKYISHYMRNIFFFDQHPPLGKQLIAGVVSAVGFDGNYTFSRIGAQYTPNVPIFWLRFLPALCGSLLPTIIYKLMLQLQLKRTTALLAGLLVILDNALLTQSRFVLMESMQLLFCTLGLWCLVKFQSCRFGAINWIACGTSAALFFTFAASIKYIGLLSFCLASYLMSRFMWKLIQSNVISDWEIIMQTLSRIVIFSLVPFLIYTSIFYVHLTTLYRAGPHDSVMTSAFQASLEGGLASITRGQPVNVVHGSQITLRHTHGRTCWLHSHAHVYPVRYRDKRGSSHQQQVTCYSFKDVNNWWIVKRPEREDLVVDESSEPIRHGDLVQLVHGITSRALNSHDVAAPVTPQCQEVSCYIDYDIKMPGEMIWRIDILNRDSDNAIWHAIKSQVRLIHESTGAALRFSGRQLPEWGFNQHEIVADRKIEHTDAIWNVEEHRYTKTQDQREREQQLLKAEMIPTQKTKLSFWEKFLELQMKMIWNSKHLQSHMYSSEPLEWPLLDKGIAYWVDSNTNGQIHLLGNLLIWYSGTLGIFIYAALMIFYVIRRRRLCYDLPTHEWQRFLDIGDIFFVGYLMHYLPYFFVDRTLFLHHYLPAFIFKLLLLCYVIEHLELVLILHCKHATRLMLHLYHVLLLAWLVGVLWVFLKILPLSYGTQKLTADQLNDLRWKDTWDFIVHREHAIVPPPLM